MKRITPFLALALLAAACSDSALPTKPSPTQPNGAPAAAPAASTALAVPNPCTACAFGPKTYIVAVKEYLERFSGDPAADYLLVVQGDGDVITRARVTINGRPYFLASPERSGLPAPPLQVSVPLKASNEMRVLVTGKPGAQVTVWVLGGAAQISAAGGTVTAPGSHARVRVNQGVVNGQLRVEIADVAGPAPTYIPLTSVSQKLTLTVGSPGTTFQGGGGLQLSVPIPAGLLAGAPIFFRTFLGAIPEPFWAPASLIANAATLSLPAAHLSDLNTVFGGSVQATFTLEMLTPSTALATAAIGPRSAAPTSAGSAFGTTPYCESVPVNIAPTPPAGSGFVDCSRFPALDPYLPPSGTLPATPQVGGVGVVFVHGWNARVAAPIDLVKEQGYDCQTNGTLFYTAWNCQPNPSKASLPGSTYFRPLDSLVATVSPNPIYTFTYASYDTFTVVGQQLAAKLAAEAQTTGLSGFVLIAHSMGGLVAREAAFRLNGGQGSAGLVKGIVALGTMHTGTAGANSFTQFFATAGCLFGVWPCYPGVPTPGAEGLNTGLGSRPNAETAIYTIAGDLDFGGSFAAPASGGPFSLLNVAGNILCAKFSLCNSDGIVPLGSALGTGVNGMGPGIAYKNYDHYQLVSGKQVPDFVHTEVINDAQSLVGPGTIAGTVRDLAGSPLGGVTITAAPVGGIIVGAGPSTATTAVGGGYRMNVPSRATKVSLSALPPGCATPAARQVQIPANILVQQDFVVVCGSVNGALIARYGLDGNALDASGNNLNGTNQGAVPTTDRFGTASSAMSFNGTGVGIDIPSQALDNMPQGTVTHWVKVNQVNHDHTILTKTQLGVVDYFQTDVTAANKVAFWVNATPGSSPLLSNSTLQAGVWYSVAVSWDGTTWRIYINGALDASRADARGVPAGTQAAAMGQNNHSLNFLNGSLDDVRIYNRVLTLGEIQALSLVPPSGSWATLADMSVPRQAFASATLNGSLYAIGGYNGSVVTTVEAYDPIAPGWTNKAAMPAARYAGNGAASIGNRIYLAGGFAALQLPQTTTYIYDASANSWTTGAAIPVAGGCGGTGVIGQQLYVFTGCPTSSTFTPSLNRYDPTADTWAPLAAPANQHEYPATAAIGTKLYVISGCTNFTAFDIYDATSNTWSAGATPPSARCEATAQVVNGKIYVLGGQGSSHQPLNTVEVYDPASNSWATLQPSPAATARIDGGSGVIGGLIYLVGGTPNFLSFYKTLEVYNP